MTEFHKENMRKHIQFLRDNAENIRSRFDMRTFIHNCGSPSCSLGYAPVSTGINKIGGTYADYSAEVFGVAFDWDYEYPKAYLYMFSEHWVSINNTPEAAAARMEAVLYGYVPDNWKYTEEFAHPIVIIPEQVTLTVTTIYFFNQ